MQNPWVGTHRGQSSAAIRISPWLYSQKKLLNIFFLPKLRDLPQIGLELKVVMFDYGFNPGNPVLDPFDTVRTSEVCTRNLIIWGITGTSIIVGAGAPAEPAYMLQVYHTHQGTQSQFFNKPVTDVELAGTAQHPHLLPHPYLCLKGDVLDCELQNLTGNNLNAQLCLLGAEFD